MVEQPPTLEESLSDHQWEMQQHLAQWGMPQGRYDHISRRGPNDNPYLHDALQILRLSTDIFPAWGWVAVVVVLLRMCGAEVPTEGSGE